jgi:hypothetical protein
MAKKINRSLSKTLGKIYKVQQKNKNGHLE